MNLQDRAKSAGYELAEDFLSDAAHEILGKLADAGINTFNISHGDIVSLLQDEDGDIDRVIRGYLD